MAGYTPLAVVAASGLTYRVEDAEGDVNTLASAVAKAEQRATDNLDLWEDLCGPLRVHIEGDEDDEIRSPSIAATSP